MKKIKIAGYILLGILSLLGVFKVIESKLIMDLLSASEMKIIPVGPEEGRKMMIEDDKRLRRVPSGLDNPRSGISYSKVKLDYRKDTFMLSKSILLQMLDSIDKKTLFKGSLLVEFGIDETDNTARDTTTFEHYCLSLSGLNMWNNKLEMMHISLYNDSISHDNSCEIKTPNYKRLITLLHKHYAGGYDPRSNKNGVRFNIKESKKWLARLPDDSIIYLYPVLEVDFLGNSDAPFSTILFSDQPHLDPYRLRAFPPNGNYGNHGTSCC